MKAQNKVIIVWKDNGNQSIPKSKERILCIFQTMENARQSCGILDVPACVSVNRVRKIAKRFGLEFNEDNQEK